MCVRPSDGSGLYFSNRNFPRGTSNENFRDRKVYEHMSEMVLAVRPDGSAYLMHHGIKGMKWGVRNEPERTGDKFKRMKRAERTGTINGKTYIQSRRTSWAQRKALKYARRAETGSVTRNMYNAQAKLGYEGKYQYHHKRDVGRTTGTVVAKRTGNAISGVATAATVAFVMSNPAMALSMGAVGGATIAVGAAAAKLAMRREYKRGAAIIAGRKKQIN